MSRHGPGTPAGVPGLTVRSARVRHARRLGRRAFRATAGQFLAEGPQAVREALAESDVVFEVFATVDAEGRHGELREDARAAGIAWHTVDDAVLAEVADAVTPQGVVAVCHDVVRGLDALPTSPRLVLVCHEIRDPGNVGAVIRCADAAGADAVVLTGDCVDPQNPKAVRASAGSLFHLPVVVHREHDEVVHRLRADGVRLFATTGSGSLDLFDEGLDLASPTAWILGNEAQGLPEDVVATSDEAVAVPILGRAESLNLATAAAVCLYASAKEQR